jgi:hypothetical protein
LAEGLDLLAAEALGHGLELGQGRLGHPDAGLAAVGWHDQLGAAVGRVRDQADQAGSLEFRDGLVDGLAGDARPAGDLGGPGAPGVQLAKTREWARVSSGQPAACRAAMRFRRTIGVS